MITLVQGSDVVSSRAFLIKQKQNYDEIIEIDLKGKSKLELPVSKTLFGKKTLLIFENFDLKKEPSLSLDESIDVIIWTNQSLAAPSWVHKNQVFKDADTWSTFRFADSVFYGQEVAALKTLSQLLNQATPAEIIIGTLTRQIRNLSLVLVGEVSAASTSTFVQGKLREQGRNWNLNKLLIAGKLVIKADWAIKSGKVAKETVLTMLTIQLCQLGDST